MRTPAGTVITVRLVERADEPRQNSGIDLLVDLQAAAIAKTDLDKGWTALRRFRWAGSAGKQARGGGWLLNLVRQNEAQADALTEIPAS